MDLKVLGYILVGGLAGGTAFVVFEKTSMVAAAIAFMTVAWILFRFTGGKLLWDTGKHLINPLTMLMLAFGLGVTYLAMELQITGSSLAGGLGIGLLGAALGMLLFKYWNIGS